jgi:hypothetical protein
MVLVVEVILMVTVLVVVVVHMVMMVVMVIMLGNRAVAVAVLEQLARMRMTVVLKDREESA